MKAFNIIFCVLFIISAGLQYNDPDPYLWVPIYLYGAFFCFKAYQEKYYPKAYLAGVIVFLVYAVYLFFDKDGVLNWLNEHHAENIAHSMKASAPWIEETREFFGLLILIIVLLINYTSYRRKKRF
ncbi:transmembrane 220 family protein [Daejeonella sp.]|uniref:transmembrane 220 family protein n=1 Tax=Daejeonella sp. TaxID=2805397 RepID=UPI0030BFBB08